MLNRKSILLIGFLWIYAFAKAQTGDTIITDDTDPDTIKTQQSIDPLRPAKAAFYAAALPGLGQAYNKDYWKLPIVYGALGTGVFFAIDNDREFKRYRTAFKDRLAGRIDEFTIVNEDGSTTEVFTNDGLIDAQDFFRRQKELAILITAGMYVLQIIEANVDAHLSQYNVSDDLTFAPDIQPDDLGQAFRYGFKITYHID
ncbi:hypothetical protein GCM10011344_30460 [Dokdonia pacifica]|uniref:DUF5683 domain-containing protein n=1 Tax=Dokdonia pacifica TaxID=1627892 RepID=A0A239E9J0_9FLAO|nr:DUF5683 domain-containing protein [Dokdonia pacifica]GGG27562.1 hypothetical protein GCM10011344_30460 [Dokdonia pacifica]SNS40948.1 hypothetical protein SAMN06265376_1157 [Dokdonia pacifica]